MRPSLLFLAFLAQTSIASSNFLTIFGRASTPPSSPTIPGHDIDNPQLPTPSAWPSSSPSSSPTIPGNEIDNPQLPTSSASPSIPGHEITPDPPMPSNRPGIYDPNKLADTTTAQKYREKGAFLLCLLNATDEEAGKAWPDPNQRTPASASSMFKGTLENEMDNWYWHSGRTFDDIFVTFSDGEGEHLNKIGSALKELGLSDLPVSKGGQNQGYAIEHFDEFVAEMYAQQLYGWSALDESPLCATGAQYRFVVNQAGGALFAQQFHSPAHAVRVWWGRAAFPGELPELRAASDILSAYWLRGNSDAKNLKYYFVNTVQNDETLGLIAAVLKNKNVDEMPIWPGAQLHAGADEGLEVLLGSPLGATLAYLLIQHKDELGVKTVTSVRVFRDNTQGGEVNVQLLFVIEDVETKKENGKGKAASNALMVQRGGGDMVRTHVLGHMGMSLL